MKTFNHFIQTITFVILAIIAKPVMAQEIHVNGQFSSDTTFSPFNGEHDIYSFKMSGYIELLSDSSLVRVVLIDDHGNHFLIYEAYPLIDTLNSFSIPDVCDETCYLDKITPDSIRVDIINAIVSIEKFTYDLTEINNVHDLQVQQKWVNDSVKIAIMNKRIQEEHMYWRAGRSYLSTFTFSEKEIRLNAKYNLQGLDYYNGGLFERVYDPTPNQSNSTLVAGFDWRFRHGADQQSSPPNPYYNSIYPGCGWITSIKQQGSTETCWIFSGIAAVEAYANLYFNNSDLNSITKHQIDLDLSEMQVNCCFGGGAFICTTGPPGSLGWFNQNSVDAENPLCLSFQCPYNLPCCTGNWATCSDDRVMTHICRTLPSGISEEDLMKTLINYGPISCEIHGYPWLLSDVHQMLLIGYSVNKVGDVVYQGNGEEDPPIILDENCKLLGSTTWWFKDSDYNYFRQISLGGSSQFTLNPLASQYFVDIIYRDLNLTLIKCSDEDGDGYYWWGIHWYWDTNSQTLIQSEPSDCGCPPGVNKLEEDCNDWKINEGPYDQTTYECTNNDINCVTSNDPIYVGPNNLLWSEDQHFHQNVIIEPGYTLTVTGQVFFSPGAKIYVGSRARLLLQGTEDFPAKLSSSCTQFWGGVEVGGNPLESQDPYSGDHDLAAYQGTVTINYGTIENAECGIKTYNNKDIMPDAPGGGIPVSCSSPSGGIIQASNATFRNNKIGVEFYPYRWSNGQSAEPNKSLFSACTYIIDAPLLAGANPEYLLKLDGINKLNILGCSFKNTVDGPSYPDRGIGIYSFNSQLKIDEIQRIPPEFPILTTFDNLYRGIYGLTGGFGLCDITIENARFSGNERGTYLSAYTEVNPIHIKNTKFQFTNNYSAENLYGIYLEHCSGYQVTLNQFDGSGYTGLPANANLIGIIVNNSGAKTNYIYNNYNHTNTYNLPGFIDLTTGIQGQNINRGIYTPDVGGPIYWPIETGLRFVCNDFTNCKNDMGILEDITPSEGTGITYFQRNCESTSGTQTPAGNTFSTNHPEPPALGPPFDINIGQNVGDIQYKYHTIPPNDPNTVRLFPDQISDVNKVTYEAYYFFSYDKTSSCLENGFYPSGTLLEIKSIINLSDLKIDSLLNLLHILTDAGSTDSLRNNIENSVPNQSYDVYLDLMNASPYLSDTVLKTSILKEDVLPNAMIRDIMVANPQSAKSEDLLNTLDNRYNPMSDSMWAEILDGRDTIGAIEELRSELSGWIQKRDIYFNRLIEYFLNDTTYEGSHDSLVSLLNNDFNLTSRYNLVTYYLGRNNFTQADNVLQDIPNDFTLTDEGQRIYQNFTTLLPVIEELVNDTLGYNIPDSIQSSELEELLSDDYNLPGAYARNILIAAKLFDYQEPILTESSQKSSRIPRHYGNKIKKIHDFKVYPNPCKDYIIVEYTKNRSTDITSFTIINANGICLSTYSLSKSSNQVIIPLKSYPPGNYFLRLNVNGINKGSQQVIKIN